MRDNLAFWAQVIAPTLAKGIIIRRKSAMFVAALADLDRRAVERMSMLRDRYEPGPLLVDLPGKSFVLPLETEQVRRVLAETPDPFDAASFLKTAVLEHFQPRGVLVSRGQDRAERRTWNEAALNTGRRVHEHGLHFGLIIDAEMDRLFEETRRDGQLGWDLFSEAWFRSVWRIVLGDRAAADRALSASMTELRRRANWAFFTPPNDNLRDRLLEQIRAYIENSDENSLAHSGTHAKEQQAPEDQISHWLFAFDSVGITVFRTLALLTGHPSIGRRVREEMHAAENPGNAEGRSLLEAAVLECLRLWPTTPLILRETTANTQWDSDVLPAGASVIIYVPFFNRDPRLPFANAFTPELWRGAEQPAGSLFVPFSAGPAQCPGRDLVLFLATATIRAILNRVYIRLARPEGLLRNHVLPGTLNHFRLVFQTRPVIR